MVTRRFVFESRSRDKGTKHREETRDQLPGNAKSRPTRPACPSLPSGHQSQHTYHDKIYSDDQVHEIGPNEDQYARDQSYYRRNSRMQPHYLLLLKSILSIGPPLLTLRYVRARVLSNSGDGCSVLRGSQNVFMSNRPPLLRIGTRPLEALRGVDKAYGNGQ